MASRKWIPDQILAMKASCSSAVRVAYDLVGSGALGTETRVSGTSSPRNIRTVWAKVPVTPAWPLG
jgi:hypothetical protein